MDVVKVCRKFLELGTREREIKESSKKSGKRMGDCGRWR